MRCLRGALSALFPPTGRKGVASRTGSICPCFFTVLQAKKERGGSEAAKGRRRDGDISLSSAVF